MRPPGSNELILSGTIGQTSKVWREDVAVPDPALFTAAAFIEALKEQGISVRGVARAKYDNALNGPARVLSSGTLLAVHDSVPLSQEIQVINKVSQNLHAEMILREVAYNSRGIGTLKAGLEDRDAFLGQIGISHDGSGVALQDGSGLARQDLTTPRSTVTLLRYMWQRPDRDVWLQSLPIGGVDGSLEHRFRNVAGASRLYAKTGSYAHVNTLSGYVETSQHRWLAFSVMVNATACPDAEVRSFIDRLCSLFLDE